MAQFVEIKMIFLETHLGEMSRKEFGHSESANAVRTENLKLKKKIVEDLRRLLKSSTCIEKDLQFESF